MIFLDTRPRKGPAAAGAEATLPSATGATFRALWAIDWTTQHKPYANPLRRSISGHFYKLDAFQ